MTRLLTVSGLILLLLIFMLPRASAQTAASSCGELPPDVKFEPSNCIPDGGSATLVTGRFGAGLVSVFIMGDVGRVGRADRTIRIGNDGILHLKIDTNNFYGSSIPSGEFRIIIKDPTGYFPPVAAPFTVEGIPPVVPTEEPTVAPQPTNGRRAAPTTGTGEPTSTVDPAQDPFPTDDTGEPTPTIDPAQDPFPTDTVEPTETPTEEVPGSTSTSVIIVDVDKVGESVLLENIGIDTIDLTGWRLVSVLGAEEQPLDGTLGGGERRTFVSNGDEIWDDTEYDPAELYDPSGNLIDYFPK